MVMASPGVKMPTMRSPGTAPPSDAKRTGRSLLMPRIGMAPPGAGGAADGGAGLAGHHQRFPGRRRRALRLRGDDLDLVAVAEFGDERGDLAVDLAADRRVADVGVNRVGEVDAVRLARQRDQL